MYQIGGINMYIYSVRIKRAKQDCLHGLLIFLHASKYFKTLIINSQRVLKLKKSL